MRFKLLKTCYLEKRILNTRFDPAKKSKVYFDASLFAVCGVLTQSKKLLLVLPKHSTKLSKNYQQSKENSLLLNLLATNSDLI